MILILETQKFVAPYSFQIFDLLNPLAGTTGYHFSTAPYPRLFFRFAYRLVLICTVVFSAVLIQYPGSIKVWIISISRAEKVQQGRVSDRSVSNPHESKCIFAVIYVLKNLQRNIKLQPTIEMLPKGRPQNA